MSRLKTLTHTALVVAALSAPAAASGTDCNRIELTSTARFDDDERPSFSAVKVLDLHPWIVLSPRRRAGAERESPELELRYFGPNGHLYQSVAFPVEGEGAASSVEGYPRPVKIARQRAIVHRGQKKRIVAAPAFPVAGTAIVTSSLYGRWRLEAWEPGGRRASCSIDFKLRP